MVIENVSAPLIADSTITGGISGAPPNLNILSFPDFEYVRIAQIDHDILKLFHQS